MSGAWAFVRWALAGVARRLTGAPQARTNAGPPDHLHYGRRRLRRPCPDRSGPA